MLPYVFIVTAILSALGALVFLWKSIVAFGSGYADTDAETMNLHHLSLLEEKERWLRNLKEIESDLALGKLSPEYYEVLKRDYRDKAKEVLQALDTESDAFREQAEKLFENVAVDKGSKTPEENQSESKSNDHA